MHAIGTTNASWIDTWSDISPMTGGIKAPPAMAETIKPDNSLECSGIFSMTNEKMIGKIFANPNPAKKIPIRVSVYELEKIQRIPPRATRHDIIIRRLGAIIRMILEPSILPTKRGR